MRLKNIIVTQKEKTLNRKERQEGKILNLRALCG
jgi:hypothetical protein